MKQKQLIRLSLQVALSLLVLSAALAQSPDGAKPQEKPASIKLGVDLVVVDAMVMERKTGRVVGNLKKEDFVLFEDGTRQEITHFGQDSLPLSVILLIDRGHCLDPFSEKVHRATLEAIGRLKPEDEVAVMAFASNVEMVQGFRTYKGAIANALDRMPHHDEKGGHCFNRAFYEAAQYMRRAANPDGRRVIIMLTALTRSFNCSGPSNDEVRNALLESGSVVCAIIPKTRAQRAENGLFGGLAGMAGMFGVPTLGLKELAEETGGEVLDDKPETLDRAFLTLVDHLRTRYSLGFVSTNTKRDGSFRKLKLDIAVPAQTREGKLVVKTRRGYKAAKGAADKTDIRPAPDR